MSQIKLTVLKQGIKSSNVVCCSFFTMKDSYRNFSKYEHYLTKFLKYQTIMEGFETIIYVDKTSKDFAITASKSYPNVTIIQFSCPLFEDDFSHIGTFGAFTRFLPLFEPNLDIVWVTDIDITENYLNMNIVKYMIENKIDLNIITTICFALRGMENKYPIMAGNLIFNKFRTNKRILTNFLDRIMEGKEEEIIQKLNNENKHKPHSKIPYGMDEYFMNKYFYKILKKSELKILTTVDYAHDSLLVRHMTDSERVISKNYYFKPTLYNFKLYKNIIRNTMKKALDKYPCYKIALENMDKFKHSFVVDSVISSADL
jgi:hypothetical protein